MSSDTDGLPRAVPSSTAEDTSHSLQIVPEKLAEHTIELGEAMVQFVAPAAPNKAAEAFGHRFEKVAHSLEQIYQDANHSAQSIYQVADEGFRRHSELGMHFIEELVLARTPNEALQLQLNFFSAQLELFAEQTREMQRQFAISCPPRNSWRARPVRRPNSLTNSPRWTPGQRSQQLPPNPFS